MRAEVLLMLQPCETEGGHERGTDNQTDDVSMSWGLYVFAWTGAGGDLIKRMVTTLIRVLQVVVRSVVDVVHCNPRGLFSVN